MVDWLIDWSIDWLIVLFEIDGLIDWSTNCLLAWFIDWLRDTLVGSLVDWMIAPPPKHSLFSSSSLSLNVWSYRYYFLLFINLVFNSSIHSSFLWYQSVNYLHSSILNAFLCYLRQSRQSIRINQLIAGILWISPLINCTNPSMNAIIG